MKDRTKGFLADDNKDVTERDDYVKELHGYLWRFVNVQFPFAGGHLDDYLDVAIQQAEYNKEQEEK